jgi:osmotically inducible protein OsmC
MKFDAYQGPFSFASRMEEGPGTNPEELLGAAHAGCFSMALSAALGQAGMTPNSISTQAAVHFGKQGEGFAISRIELSTEADIPGMENAQFQQIAQSAKANCPVSKALTGVEIELNAKLLSAGDMRRAG